MPTCPHCGREIEPATPPQVVWWKPDLTPHHVNLGCGSLILIAVIVAICSGGGGLSGRIEHLDTNVQQLERKIDELGKMLDQMRK
jgi:hypothetical protein